MKFKIGTIVNQLIQNLNNHGDKFCYLNVIVKINIIWYNITHYTILEHPFVVDDYIFALKYTNQGSTEWHIICILFIIYCTGVSLNIWYVWMCLMASS